MAKNVASAESGQPGEPALGPAVLPIRQPGARHRASLRLSLVMQIVAIVLDIASVWLAFWLAYQLRYRLELGGTVSASAMEDFSAFIPAAWVATALLIVIFASRGVYALRSRNGLLDDVQNVFGGFAMVMSGVILFAYLAAFSPSRLIFVYVMLLGLLLLVSHRYTASMVRRKLHAAGVAIDRVLVVGEGESARRLMQSLVRQAGWGYQLVGYVTEASDQDNITIGTERGVLTRPRLGTTEDVGEIVKRYHVDEVLIVGDNQYSRTLSRIVELCRESVVQFRLVPDLVQISMDRMDISEIDGIPTIGIRDASIRGWNAFLKRLLDILIAGVGFVVFLMPMVAVALLIKRDSEGGVFYRQTRIGQYGRPFTMIKFRCMVANADEKWAEMVQSSGGDGRVFKDPNDPRLTRVGRHLRRFSLDELPQLINVMRGDMSIVGPRPPLEKEVAAYEDWHKQRLLVRPGLTGLWQVNGRSDLSFDEMIRLDLYYAENWSPWLDTKILLRTIPAVLFGRGAY